MADAAFQWITHHGYVGIFSLLVFGIVGLPVPDEWLLTFSGYLVFKRTLFFIPAFAAAFLGSASGITVSYALGRIFDTYVLMKYGRYFHLTPDRLERVHSWFETRGRWTLIIGYFIPGVRHLTGYVAGASELSYPSFALFAYSGAFCWALVFITLGYMLGEEWDRVLRSLHQTKLLMILAAAAVAIAYFAFVYRRRRRAAAAQ
jgi:membrane protein DedA with SNARE-associated domain